MKRQQNNSMQSGAIRLAVFGTVWLLIGSFVVAAALLDGTKFKVKVVPDKASADKGAKEFADELIFAEGKLTSTTLLPKGFKPAKYHSESEPNEAEFEAEQRSATNGVAAWTGEIRETNTVGGLVWTRPNGTNFTYEFTGTRQ